MFHDVATSAFQKSKSLKTIGMIAISDGHEYVLNREDVKNL